MRITRLGKDVDRTGRLAPESIERTLDVIARFARGQPTGEYEDFLVGFVTQEGNVWGRPAGVAVAKDGSLMVTDDGSGTVWRVAYTGKK